MNPWENAMAEEGKITRTYNQDGSVTLESNIKGTEEISPPGKRIDLNALPQDAAKTHYINGNFDINGANRVVGAQEASNYVNGAFGESLITFNPEHFGIDPTGLPLPILLTRAQYIEGGELADVLRGDRVTDNGENTRLSNEITLPTPDGGVIKTRIENGDRDTIFGKGGNDFIEGGPAGDALDGGPGDDIIFGGNAPDDFPIPARAPKMLAPEAVLVDEISTTIVGNDYKQDEPNTANGGSGNDKYYGEEGLKDIVTMSTGIDSYHFNRNEDDELHVNLTPKGYTGGKVELLQGQEEGCVAAIWSAEKDGETKVLGIADFVENVDKIVGHRSDGTTKSVSAKDLENLDNKSKTIEDLGPIK